MTADQIAGTLLIGGSAVFLVGAAVGVPRVFTERDPTVRLRMLEERLGTWRAVLPTRRPLSRRRWRYEVAR